MYHAFKFGGDFLKMLVWNIIQIIETKMKEEATPKRSQILWINKNNNKAKSYVVLTKYSSPRSRE